MAKEGYGFLFPVAASRREENGPTATGQAILNGKIVEVAAWTKHAENTNTKYLSLKFQGYELTVDEVVVATASPPSDDIPF